jgi:hypothetical protein
MGPAKIAIHISVKLTAYAILSIFSQVILWYKLNTQQEIASNKIINGINKTQYHQIFLFMSNDQIKFKF